MPLQFEWLSAGNGLFVWIACSDGRSAFLQGDDAAIFMDRINNTNDKYTDADVCREYESLLE